MKKEKTRNFIYIWILVALIMIAIMISSIHFYHSLQSQLFSERQSHLTEMTVKISEVIDVTIETMQEKVDSAKGFIVRSSISEDNATNILEELSKMFFLEDGALLALDSQGHYYSSEGIRGRWSDMEDLVAEETAPVIRDFMIGGENRDCMVFYSKLEQPKSMGDGSELTHVAAVVPMETMKEYLNISMFGDECYTYLINSQGRRLYRQTYSQTFIEDINVISALKEDEFIMGGTVEDLIEAVSSRENLCVEFCRQDSQENYFVSTVPVSGSSWTVLLFVPTDVLGVQTKEFMSSMMIYFIGIALGAIVIFVCVIYVFSANRNDKKLIAQQEENNRLLTQAAEEARNANAAKSEFLAHMSHDIRTPINGILGMTHIAIENKNDPERIDDCLHKINGAADHLLTLINDVLDMSAIESGKVVISHAPMDIRVIINNCISIISGQLMSRDLQLVNRCEEISHPYVFGDELHLRQVFINILGNAVKFTPDGGRIEFTAQETAYEDKKVSYRFTFTDTGIGISEEFQEKIFDEFSQEAKDGRSTYKGTGLGMAISRKFVELMGGTIRVKSKVGEGSCFTVELTMDTDEEYRLVAEKDSGTQLQGMKVLLVEDNELNMEIAEVILSEQGILVTKAVNGKEAVDKFAASKPGDFDAVLMDVMMPVMNGYDATRAIRNLEHPMAKTIPIIAMTANAYREDVEMAMEAGMNEHIAKPINIQLLLTVLDKYSTKEKQ